MFPRLVERSILHCCMILLECLCIVFSYRPFGESECIRSAAVISADSRGGGSRFLESLQSRDGSAAEKNLLLSSFSRIGGQRQGSVTLSAFGHV